MDVANLDVKKGFFLFLQTSSVRMHDVNVLWYDIPWRIHGTGIFTYIYQTNQPNVGEYTIYGSYGYGNMVF